MRGDHSTAILLPDARVLSAGGEGANESDMQAHADKLLANIFCPPYLFLNDTLATRPSLTAATRTITWGQTFDVCVADTAKIRSACLIAPGATTHTVDMNQRFVPITILTAAANPGRLLLQAPASPDSAPPGYYMLFLLGSADGDSVPSVARWVRISSTPPGPPDELSLTADLITCDAIGPIRWQAPTEATGGARAIEYDIRYSLSPINTDNFGSATPLSGVPNPACWGIVETGGSVISLAPATTVYFAGKSKSATGVWSDLGYAEMATLYSCGGSGGGLSMRREQNGREEREPNMGRPGQVAPEVPAGDDTGEPSRVAAREGMPPGRAAERSSMSGTTSLRLVGEFSSGSALRWRLHYVDLAGDEARLTASARRLLFEEPDGAGGWTMRDSTQIAGGLAGIRMLPGAGRLIFPAGTTVEALESNPLHFEVEDATHTDLGEIAMGDSGVVAMSVVPGDTLDLTFGAATTEGDGEDCVLLVRLPGGAGSTLARRPGRRPAPEAPPTEAPVAETVPTSFALHPARPNPFSGETTLRFDLPSPTRVRLELFDVQGRRVARLLDRTIHAGRHSTTWDGRLERGGVAGAGVYLLRMTAGSFVDERRIVLLP